MGTRETNLWSVGNGSMVVIVVISYNSTPFLHSLRTKGKEISPDEDHREAAIAGW